VATVRITLRRSLIGNTEPQRRTVRALGLRRVGQTVEHSDSRALRGMILKVAHLVTVEEADSRATE
jgi:large subunit ribosomal protein L30